MFFGFSAKFWPPRSKNQLLRPSVRRFWRSWRFDVFGDLNMPWDPLRSIQRAILTLWRWLSTSGDVSDAILKQLKFWRLGSRIWPWDPLKSIRRKILTLWRWLSASGDGCDAISSNFNIFIDLWNAGRPELSTWLIANLAINQVGN